MQDCKARVLLTCNGGMRASKKIELKQIADSAIQMCAAQGHSVSVRSLRAVLGRPVRSWACSCDL